MMRRRNHIGHFLNTNEESEQGLTEFLAKYDLNEKCVFLAS
jgi:hypothetical protein